jgi:4-hydroxybenzoate polyprenyltransferase
VATQLVVYPRFGIRTSQACAVAMTVLFVLMILLMVIGTVSSGRPWMRLGLPFACAVMSLGFGRRALGQLQVLEQTKDQPDDVMVALFDIALGVPTLGLLAVIAAVGI